MVQDSQSHHVREFVKTTCVYAYAFLQKIVDNYEENLL